MSRERSAYQKPSILERRSPSIESQETPPQPFNILAEVDLALHYLDHEGNVPENVREYIRLNEQTQALEATTKVIHTTHQLLDESQTLTGYGIPMRAIAESGIATIQNTIASNGPQFAFELHRRIIELGQIDMLEDDLRNSRLDENVRIVISPYPEDAQEEDAGEIGYFTDTRVFMIRAYTFDSQTHILTTTQIQLENSNARRITHLLGSITGETFDMPLTPAQILGGDILIPKDNPQSNPIEIAKMYDAMITEQLDEQFYLGMMVDSRSQAYEDLSNKTTTVHEHSAIFIDELVETDLELARSLKNEVPTNRTSQMINQARFARNSNGKFELTQSQRDILSQSLNHFTRETATILKDFKLRNTYSELKCIVETDEATHVFGETHVQKVQHNYYHNVPEEIRMQQIYNMASSSEFIFRFCGGAITLGSQNSSENMYIMPFSTFRNILSGGSERKFVKNCGQCGKVINATISAGYKCSCGGVYEGC